VGNSQTREGWCPKSISGEDWFSSFHPILSGELLDLSDRFSHDFHGFQRHDSIERSEDTVGDDRIRGIFS
jgi:hypothetical protein